MKNFVLAIAASLVCVLPVEAQDVFKPVKLIVLDTDAHVVSRQFFGKVVARQTVDLAFQVGGQVIELPAIEGARVAKGGLVGRLDTEPYERSLEQAQIQKAQADRAVERFQKLQGSAVSQVALDDAITNAGLADLAVRNAEYELAHATLSSPFDALISTRLIENFTTISAGTPIVRLHDMSELRIEIDVPEVLFQVGSRNKNLEVFAQFPSRDEIFPIEIREFDAETSDIGQTYKITFGLTPPEDFNILPGSSVTVFATLGDKTDEVLVPPTSLAIANDGALSVLVFEATEGDLGVLKSIPVTAKADVTGQMLLISGFENGMEIVAMGANTLSDGQVVRRFNGFDQ